MAIGETGKSKQKIGKRQDRQEKVKVEAQAKVEEWEERRKRRADGGLVFHSGREVMGSVGH